jgi:hypothetical protein
VGARLLLGGAEGEKVAGWYWLGLEWALWALWEGRYAYETESANTNTEEVAGVRDGRWGSGIIIRCDESIPVERFASLFTHPIICRSIGQSSIMYYIYALRFCHPSVYCL